MQNQKILITGQWLIVNEALAIHKADVSYFYRQGRDIFIHYLNNGFNHSEKVTFTKPKEAKEQLKRLCVRWDAD